MEWIDMHDWDWDWLEEVGDNEDATTFCEFWYRDKREQNQ